MHKSFLGDSNSLPLTSEAWSGEQNCGSTGSVQVKCTKINGKQFERIINSTSTFLGKQKENQNVSTVKSQVLTGVTN